MAQLSVNGLDGLTLSLDEIAAIPDDVIGEILTAEAKVVEEAQKRLGSAYGVERTGMTVKSIATSEPKRSPKDNSVSVYVTPQGKNPQGVRYAEIGFINNYGKRHQAARPFITDANESAAEEATNAGYKVYDEWLQKKGL